MAATVCVCSDCKGELDPEDGICHACQYASEMAAENGWMRAAEYDPESQDQMDRDDMMGFT
jgi:predicted amidophosphoribosyltransferase